jgi:hypothetical protein
MNVATQNVFLENSFRNDRVNTFNYTRDEEGTGERSKNSTLSFKHLNIDTYQENNNTNILSNGFMGLSS